MARAQLDADIAALSGREGDVVYTHRKSGTFVRPYARPSNPRTPRQQAQRASMGAVTRAWALLGPSEVAAWEEWGRTHPSRGRLSGEPYAPSAFNAFASLGLKYLRLHPNGTPPTLPPDETFAGDRVRVAVAVSGRALVWTASRANAAGVATELLAQSLAKVNSVPRPEKWDVRERASFGDAPAPIVTPLPPGLYAVAWRFVCLGTGETTDILGLPNVWVP